MSIKKPMLIQSLITQSGGVIKASTAIPGYTVSYDDRIPLEALDASVDLNIDGASSSASIRLATGTNVDGRAYVEMFTVQGSAGIFRTRSPQIGYGSQNTTLQLEHAVNEIGDFIIADSFEKEMTLKEAMKKIFKYYGEKSKVWKLGTVQDPVDPNANDKNEEKYTKCVLSVNYDNCLDAIQSVMEQYPYMMLTFDFGTTPWKLNVKNKPTLSEAQGRLSRNVKSATVVRDDSELFTRVYAQKADGKFDKYDAMSFYKNKYGLIETVISAANETDDIWKQSVKSYIKTHKKPKYSITIDGIDLSNITGETLDKFKLGRLMTLALPDYKTTISEVIAEVSFPSIYRQPNFCTVTLNSEPDRVIKYIKKAQKTASRAASAVGAATSPNAVTYAYVKDNTLYMLNSKGEEIVNFSKAVTSSESWSGGKFTAKLYQTNAGKKTQITPIITTQLTSIELQANASTSLSGTYNVRIPLRAMYYSATASSKKLDTGYKQDLIVSAKPVYDNGKSAGWLAAYGKVDLPKEKTNDHSFYVKTPAKTVNAQKSTTFNMVNHDNDNVDCQKWDNKWVTVARINHGKYTAGKKAATVSLTHGTVTEDSNYQKHVKYTAANTSNTSNRQEIEFYLVKSGNRSQLRTGSATGTLIMEIYNT